jgi:hypothetical protein
MAVAAVAAARGERREGEDQNDLGFWERLLRGGVFVHPISPRGHWMEMPSDLRTGMHGLLSAQAEKAIPGPCPGFGLGARSSGASLGHGPVSALGRGR